MKQIELKALAKINLGLDVLGRRENGYHDVRMIMQSVYLYDDVVIVRKDLPGIEVETICFSAGRMKIISRIRRQPC